MILGNGKKSYDLLLREQRTRERSVTYSDFLHSETIWAPRHMTLRLLVAEPGEKDGDDE